jgi:hypothetical protein
LKIIAVINLCLSKAALGTQTANIFGDNIFKIVTLSPWFRHFRVLKLCGHPDGYQKLSYSNIFLELLFNFMKQRPILNFAPRGKL